MRHCPNCQCEISESALACKECGQDLTPTKPMRKFQLNKKMIAYTIAGILVCSIVGICAFNYRLTQVFNQAVAYYNDNALLDFEEIRYELYSKQGETFDNFLQQEALGVFEQYKGEELSYNEAIGLVKRIQSFSNKSSNIETYYDQIVELKQSRKALEEAKDHEINKQWEEAYNRYQQVVDWDPAYATAQKGAEAALRWWLQDVLVEAVTYYEDGAYDDSLATIEKGLKLSPGNEAFIELQDAVQVAITEGETENKWSDFKDKIVSSIQSGVENLQNIFNKIFGN